MRGLACLVALAACGDGGVVIIVDPAMGMNVDEVRLYLGHGDRSMTSRLTTAKGGVSNASYWTRDVNNEADIAHPDAPNGSVGFTLVRDDSTTLPVAIAVGFAQGKIVGEAVATDLPIPRGQDFIAYHMPLLGPVSTLDAPSAHEAGLWSPPGGATAADQQACAGVAIDTNGHQTRAFVVTDNDQDCDGIASDDPLECDPNAYLADRPANRGEISCLVPKVNECYLGGPHCKDGAPKSTTCDPTTYCLPSSVCNACTDGSLKCPTDPARTTQMTGYYCALSVDPVTGDACETTLYLDRPPTGGFACTKASIRSATSMFGDNVDLGGLTFDVHLDPSCAVTLQPSGKLPVTAQAALLAFDLENGHGLGMPITFGIAATPGCAGSDTTCVLDSSAFTADLTACMAGWSPPTPASLVNSNGSVTDPSLTDDMLEMYFEQTGDIYVATRPDTFAPWVAIRSVDELNTGATERGANVSPDGLAMMFASDFGGSYALYTSTRPNRSAQWAMPQRVQSGVLGNVFEGARDETGDHLVIVVDNGGSYYLEELVRTGSGPYVPGPLLGFDALSIEMTPHLSPNGLHLYFATDIESTGGRHMELYVASRNTIDEPFSNSVWLAELGSLTFDGGVWVSRDAHTIYFASDRGATGAAIYTATR